MQIPKHTKLVVSAKHLPKGSHAEICVICDYCGREINKTYKDYNTQKKSIVKKDCCEDCNVLKTKDVLMNKYGRITPLYSYTFEEVKVMFEDKGYDVTSTEYVDFSAPINYTCRKHVDKGIQDIKPSMLNRSGCYYCGLEQTSGENHYKWNGGKSNIRPTMFEALSKWKQDSMELCNYTCIFTQCKFDNIHHLYPFSNIINEVFELLDVEYHIEIGKYTSEQLSMIKDKCKELHEFYGLGVCLCKPIHKLYHKLYGIKGTWSSFIEFSDRVKSGEFDSYLNDNNLTLNINEDVFEKMALIKQYQNLGSEV